MATTVDPTPQPDLDELADRLARARLRPGAAPLRGISRERVAELVSAWQHLNWRAAEAELADLGSALTTTGDGRRLHFLHRKADQAMGVPVVLLHGWPDTPWMYRHLMPLLLAAGHDVVVPTAAGFGYSEEPSGELSADLVAGDVHALMTELGYEQYAVHGTDWGATTGAALAAAHPEAVVALHLLQPPFDRAFLVDRATASETEIAYLQQMDAWGEGAAYVSVQMSQADTLAAAFDDSPVGLLAWLAEKYQAWSGDGVSDEDILLSVATMWLTGSFRSSVRLYSEPTMDWDSTAGEGEENWGSGDAGGWEESADDGAASGWGAGRIEVPTAFAVFPDDIGQPPREFAERFFAVERYTVMPRGGHWAALEEPQLVADDLIAFLAPYAAGGSGD